MAEIKLTICSSCGENSDLNEAIIRGIAEKENTLCMKCVVDKMDRYCQFKGNKIKRCDRINCYPCHLKSFSSHDFSIYYSTKNKSNPRYCQSKNIKVWITCKNGHEEYIVIRYLCARKVHCLKCSSVSKRMFVKWEIIEKEFIKRDYQLLTKENEYKDRNSPLRFLCPNGHKYFISWTSFRRGSECYKCSEHCYKEWNDIVKKFEEREFIMLSVAEDYLSNRSLLKYRCKVGHEHSISWQNFHSGHGCQTCGRLIGIEKQKKEWDEVVKIFTDKDCKLLSTKDQYKNQNSPLSYICSCGREKITSYCYISRNVYGCKQCSGTGKTEWHVIENEFIKANYQLLSGAEDYDTEKSWFNFICNNDHKGVIRWRDFKRGVRCRFCRNKTEAKLKNFISTLAIIESLEVQKGYDFCRNKLILPFDFIVRYKLNGSISTNHIIIELDGNQHFKYIETWNTSLNKIQERDVFKMKKVLEYGHSVIRICQQDVWFDTKIKGKTWGDSIVDIIKKIISQNIENIYTPKIYYLSSIETLYDSHKNFIKNKDFNKINNCCEIVFEDEQISQTTKPNTIYLESAEVIFDDD